MSTQFRVGDRVRFPIGRGSVIARITEDIGPLGVNGRHLYQLLIPMDPFDPEPYHVSEEDIEPLDEAAEAARRVEKDRAIDYFRHGGLLSMLRSNLSGGRNQPQVWLTLDSLGNVTHTFYPEWGLLGGETVPAGVIRGDKVYAPKQEEVLSFLESFGLDRAEAEGVLGSVGTSHG